MKTSDFNYNLPAEKIAQVPLAERDQSRLLTLNRRTGEITHHQFNDILDFLQPGDVLVGNDSRVMPARLHGKKTTGGKVELLLLKQIDELRWRVLVGGKRCRPGVEVIFDDNAGIPTTLTATIQIILDGAAREISFNRPIEAEWDELGHTPLPPYIHTRLENRERYQTIYSRSLGSAAAPTAGLHFSPDLLIALRKKGIIFETVTLHVGLDTFKPVASEIVTDHTIHSEWIRLSPESAKRINEAKLAGGKIVAVGTTSVRVLETGAWRSAGIHTTLQHVSQQTPPDFCPWKPVAATEGHTDLFIYPGYHFRAVDALITNFHIPQSSLMMLVSAFAGQDNIRRAYTEALTANYRFLSFGDAMFIT